VSVIFGLDITEIITIFTSILAIILGIISFIAYRRDQRSKFLLVTLAFAIFALEGVLIVGSDVLSYGRFPDIIASLLDFVMLVCIFLSITLK
jgi:formate-dependent nitrite reductase membrane component NrfD